jgi:hypothetical protein
MTTVERAGLGIDAVDPGDVLGELPDVVDVAGFLVEYGDEAPLFKCMSLSLPPWLMVMIS